MASSTPSRTNSTANGRSCVEMLTARTSPLSRTDCNSSRTCGVKYFRRVTPKKWKMSM